MTDIDIAVLNHNEVCMSGDPKCNNAKAALPVTDHKQQFSNNNTTKKQRRCKRADDRRCCVCVHSSTPLPPFIPCVHACVSIDAAPPAEAHRMCRLALVGGSIIVDVHALSVCQRPRAEDVQCQQVHRWQSGGARPVQPVRPSS